MKKIFTALLIMVFFCGNAFAASCSAFTCIPCSALLWSHCAPLADHGPEHLSATGQSAAEPSQNPQALDPTLDVVANVTIQLDIGGLLEEAVSGPALTTMRKMILSEPQC